MSTLYSSEQLAAAGKVNFEILASIAHKSLGGVERVTALNLNTGRSILEDGVAGTRQLLDARNIKELISLQSDQLPPAAKRTAAYARNLYDIVAQTQKGFTELFEERFADFNTTLASELSRAAKTAPKSAGIARAAVKPIVAAADPAEADTGKKPKQASEIAGDEFFATTAPIRTAARAANVAAPARKAKKPG
jgi:phasin family protein